MTGNIIRKTSDKIRIFKNLFSGLSNAYGTYDPITGRSSQVKAPVTDKVILAHLTGKQPYGVYLLVNNKTLAIAVDFDTNNKLPSMEFVGQAKHYGITAYIESSKSKGYHVWIFFDEKGVLAFKARLVVRNILDDIEQPDTEVFPKQDVLDSQIQYGNFINAPLFGALVPKGKTVFVDPTTFEPYPNQWDFLETVKRYSESDLDDIIELNNLSTKREDEHKRRKTQIRGLSSYSLPPCARIILEDGVAKNQRCVCFRLAGHFNRLGIPIDGAIVLLKNWAIKNKPIENKRIITENEIFEQATYAYKRSYTSYGCESAEIKPFCHPECPVNLAKLRSK
jgi:hypothetical protein